MNDDAMANRDAAANMHRLSRIGVNDAMILHVRVLAHSDPVIVTAQHSAEPDARAFPQVYFSDQNRIRRDPAIIRNLGRHAIQRINRHSHLFRETAVNYSHTAPQK
jgi:hypothetical protein